MDPKTPHKKPTGNFHGPASSKRTSTKVFFVRTTNSPVKSCRFKIPGKIDRKEVGKKKKKLPERGQLFSCSNCFSTFGFQPISYLFKKVGGACVETASGFLIWHPGTPAMFRPLNYKFPKMGCCLKPKKGRKPSFAHFRVARN